MYKTALAAAPEVLSMPLLRIIDPTRYFNVQYGLESPPENLCDETILWIDVNIDGIALYKTGIAPQGVWPWLQPSYGLHHCRGGLSWDGETKHQAFFEALPASFEA